MYQLAHLWRNLEKNHPLSLPEDLFPTLGLANWITMARAAFLALLAGFLFLPRPQGPAIWVPGGLYLTAAILDFMDGWAARAAQRTSYLGEVLDMHWDGFGVLVGSLLLIQYGQVPVWYLLVGLARYLFVFGLWLRQRMGKKIFPLPPSPVRRGLAGLQMGFIAVALLPVFTPPATWAAATIFMLPLVIGFVRDWLSVSGLLLPPAEPLTSSERQLDAISWVRSWLPLILRAVVVSLLTAALALELNSAAPRAGVLLAGAAGLLLLGLGVMGRAAALGVVLLCGFILREAPLNGLYWAILFVCAGVMLAGTGRYSLWKPEDWLIFHRAGEANQPH